MAFSAVVPEFLQSLSNLLKPGQISDKTELLEHYSMDISCTTRGSPFFVVYPDNRQQVQAIVKLAGQYKVPLTPVSSGQPHFRDDTIPNQGGIIIDFSRMQQILKIDAISRYAWIESGVTFGKLMPLLKQQGLKMDVPLLPRATKSVVTSRLEREPVIIPKYQYDYIDPLLTLEVVYGTGDDFRTGSASGPGSLDTLKADKVNPWGPGTVDYYRLLSGAQGTLGLVTWAITKVEVLPSMHELYFIPLDNAETITNIMNQLLRRRIVDECLALNNVNLATILADSTSQDYERLKQLLPQWTLIVGISGYRLRPEERMEIQKKHLLEICADAGIKASPHLKGLEGKEKWISDLLGNPWTEETYWKLKFGRTCQDIFYLTQLSKVADLHEVMQSVTDKLAYSQDIGGYIQPMVQGRGCHCEYNLFYAKDDIKQSTEVNTLFLEASQTLMNKGGFFSRPYGKWSNMVYSQNATEVSSLRKLKGIYDPLNILNPGKLCF